MFLWEGDASYVTRMCSFIITKAGEAESKSGIIENYDVHEGSKFAQDSRKT